MYTVNKENAITNTGNTSRLRAVMRRAERGEKITLGFIGGSITYGSLATSPELCYAARVADWWRRSFPKAEIHYVNAGIGATCSFFGTARAEKDLLSYHPDFVIVEYSVNDQSTDFYMETYEGLVRRILEQPGHPAVMAVHSVRYDDGGNTEIHHGKVVRHYDLPAVSMQSSIYQEIVRGRIPGREIMPDDLHPNDVGHAMMADIITYYLEKVRNSAETVFEEDVMTQKLPESLTKNCYEHATQFENDGISPVSDGFVKDEEPQEELGDTFKNGWFSAKTGSSIVFCVDGSEIGITYRKYCKCMAPVADVYVDGEKLAVLDANFPDGWGDYLAVQNILLHGEKKQHTVEVVITECPKETNPFYLRSVIVG